jgi:two-component system chemotaxis response regulator CheY
MILETILIVEDQRGFRRIYRDALESQGYTVLVAEDGEMGLDLVRLHKPSLILLDLGLPRMSGFEVLRKIREDVSLDKVRVVIFSVTGEEKDVEKALGMGANGYVLKGGHTPRQIIEVIQGLLNPKEKAAGKGLGLKIPEVA